MAKHEDDRRDDLTAGPQRPAEHARDEPTSASGKRAEAGRQDTRTNQAPGGLENPETALGGADAVQKTSYVTGKGTDPDQKGPGRGR